MDELVALVREREIDDAYARADRLARQNRLLVNVVLPLAWAALVATAIVVRVLRG